MSEECKVQRGVRYKGCKECEVLGCEVKGAESGGV